MKPGCIRVWEGPSIPDPPPIQAGVGTPGGKKGGHMISSTEGWFFSTGEGFVGGERRTHQAGPGSPELRQREHTGRARRPDPRRKMY